MDELNIPDWDREIKFLDEMSDSENDERKRNLAKIFRDQSNLQSFNADSTMKFLYAVGHK